MTHCNSALYASILKGKCPEVTSYLKIQVNTADSKSEVYVLPKYTNLHLTYVIFKTQHDVKHPYQSVLIILDLIKHTPLCN